MAILCDNCRTVNVKTDGDICSECQVLIEESKIDRSYMNNIYMPDDLFDKFAKLVKHVEDERSGARKAIGKFLHNLKTGFIDKFTGKEINDPTPSVIIPKEKTLDRIDKILKHNLAVYAREADLDTLDRDWETCR